MEEVLVALVTLQARPQAKVITVAQVLEVQRIILLAAVAAAQVQLVEMRHHLPLAVLAGRVQHLLFLEHLLHTQEEGALELGTELAALVALAVVALVEVIQQLAVVEQLI